MGGNAPEPLSAADVAVDLEALFGPHKHVVLAVSGGPDSMALMHLAAEWLSARQDSRPVLSVVTVDHGLRAESRAEAEFVAVAAAKLGMPHTILTWYGTKPKTGIQETARNARHELFRAHLEREGHNVIATAHTRDDQAETLLMRLARGSGLDGLAGMRRQSLFAGGHLLVRPLLAIPKARLVGTLQARSVSWIEDPSNSNPNFERVRLRSAQRVLGELGLSREALGLSAQRLTRARVALEAHAAETVARHPDKIHVDRLGYASLDWDFMRSLPEDTALRILQRIIQSYGAQVEPVSLSQLEDMTLGRRWENPSGRTLAGARFVAGKHPSQVLVVREAGRQGLAEFVMQPGEHAEWDNRFAIVLPKDLDGSLRIAALGPDGVKELRAAGCDLSLFPREALLTAPGFFTGSVLAAAPCAGYACEAHRVAQLSARFVRPPFPTASEEAGGIAIARRER